MGYMSTERLAGVLIEDRPPSPNIEVPEIAAQLEDPAIKTRPGVVAAALERQGIPVFFVGPDALASGRIDTYRRLNSEAPGGFESHTVAEGQIVQILAARVRDWLGNAGRDPSFLPAGNTYNNRKIREEFALRDGVKTWLDRWLGNQFRMPHETIVHDAKIPQLTRRFSDFVVKPLRATETTENRQQRAAVVSRAALQAQGESLGREVVVQPRLKNVDPKRLIRKLGLDKLGIALNLDSVTPDAHNELTIYHTPGRGSRAAVVELKFHNPSDIGTFYGTWSIPFDMKQLSQALPDAQKAYERLARGLDEDFLGLCNVGIKLVLSTNWRKKIKVHVSGISLRPFTPDADQGDDQYRQHYADLLAQTEIDTLASMFRSRARQASL